MPQPQKLIAFDIDGTIIKNSPAERHVVLKVLHAITSIEIPLDAFAYHGRTANQNTIEFLKSAFAMRRGWYTDVEKLTPSQQQYITAQAIRNGPRFQRLYLRHLKRDLPRQPDALCPGADALLKTLAAHQEDIALGLLTGNWRQGAQHKLAYHNLWTPFVKGRGKKQHVVGSFAEDGYERNDLGPILIQRAEKAYGTPFFDVYIVGDTQHDHDCGVALRAWAAKHRPQMQVHTILVATGKPTFDELSRLGATAVFKNFENPHQLINLIQTTPPPTHLNLPPPQPRQFHPHTNPKRAPFARAMNSSQSVGQ